MDWMLISLADPTSADRIPHIPYPESLIYIDHIYTSSLEVYV